MSDYLSWDPKISLGIEEIDLEHYVFVVLINRLEDVKADHERRSRVLQTLIKYAAFHFQSEENIYFDAGYPDIETHRASHLALLDQLNIVLMELRGGEVDFDQILAFFKKWYINHTSKEDYLFVEFLKQSSNRSAAQIPPLD